MARIGYGLHQLEASYVQLVKLFGVASEAAKGRYSPDQGAATPSVHSSSTDLH